MKNIKPILRLITGCGLFITLLAACGGSGGGSNSATVTETDNEAPDSSNTNSLLDDELRNLITNQGLTGDPSTNRNLPTINDPLAQLGKQLFFSKSLGGEFDAACVSCHHPVLGGGDSLALPVGTEAINPDLLGPGRIHSTGIPPVPRNSPTVFNVGLWDSGLFWDSRLESLGKEVNANGADSGIRTPDSRFGVADINAGSNLVVAQARFPVTSADEMKTSRFENGSSNDAIRNHLAARIGNYAEGSDELASTMWLSQFQAAFDSTDTAEQLITFDNIALAIGEYERSMVFINNPWKEYVEGNNAALSEQQKQGAILFFTAIDDGGAGCSSCHSGDQFTDGLHHVIAFPQIGPGKGDGSNDDFGRARETANDNERYHFRTASLLNISVTAPYSHSGAYATLQQVVRHYNNPRDRIADFFEDGGWCQLEQFETITDCENLYPDAQANSELALQQLNRERNNNTTLFQNTTINNNETEQIVLFLESLTDPCVTDRVCLEPWIADPALSGPDGMQLNAIGETGDLL